jgi:hypothetical protein
MGGCRLSCVQEKFSEAYYHLGKYIYRNPACFFLIPAFLTYIGYQYMDLTTDLKDPISLIIIKGSRMDNAHERSKEHFNQMFDFIPLDAVEAPKEDCQGSRRKREISNEEDSIEISAPDWYRVGNALEKSARTKRSPENKKELPYPDWYGILVMSQDRQNIFRKEHFVQLKALDERIKSDEYLNCSDCGGSKLLELFDLIDDIEAGNIKLTWPSYLHRDRFEAFIFPALVATPTLSANGNILKSTPGLVLFYHKRYQTKE